MSFALARAAEGRRRASRRRLEVDGRQRRQPGHPPGEAFFAIPGLRTHGDAFAAQAQGARRRGDGHRPRAGGRSRHAGRRRRRCARRLCAGGRARSSRRSPRRSSGVTGTNGKSSIVSFVRQIWAACGIRRGERRHGRYRDRRGPDAGRADDAGCAVAAPRSRHAAAPQGIDHVAMEASSQGLDQRRVDGVRFSAVAFTNLSRDHLDYHADMDAYRDAKLRLFTDLLARRRRGGGQCRRSGARALHVRRARSRRDADDRRARRRVVRDQLDRQRGLWPARHRTPGRRAGRAFTCR